MNKHLIRCLLTLLLVCTAQNSNAQENKTEKIAKAFTDYFFLERENIHVHLNKRVFLTNEQIWFKGYVFHRKKNAPFFPTTNIFATLIDQDGKAVATKLLYGSMGSFSGSFDLNALKTGKYHIQFYTNWMNNFIEDESAVYKVAIIDKDTGPGNVLAKVSTDDINIDFFPEGGTLLSGTANIVGIHISGCDRKPLEVSSMTITDAAGNVVKTVPISKEGYGKFDLPAQFPAGYKAIVDLDGKKHSKALPEAQLTGITLEVNNFTMPDNTIVKIRTNKLSAGAFEGKPLFVVASHDDKVIAFEAPFKDNTTEQTLAIPNADLPEGLITLRVLDNSLNLLAERMIYKYSKETLQTEPVKNGKTGDGTEFTMQVPANMDMSISILPAESISSIDDYDMYGDLLLLPYLENPGKINGAYYLDNPSRGRKYELDIFLLSQKSKYSWNDILRNPPKSSSSFDIGISLKGNIGQNIKNPKDYKVHVYSPAAMINEYLDITNSGEFFLDNLIVKDSTRLNFELLEKNTKKQPLKLAPQISNNIRKFNKPYKPAPACPVIANETQGSADMPYYRTTAVELDEITVEGKTSKLKYEKSGRNWLLRAYKISPNDSRSFFYILDFIRYHGFDVVNTGANVSIYGRTVNTINGQRTTPMVYVDNVIVMSFDQLMGIQTDDVDEFYINQHAVVPSVNNKMGIIRIYMKKDFSYRDKKQDDTSFILKEGFQKIMPFNNESYSTMSGKGFENFGVVDWFPLLTADEKGLIKFIVPNNSPDTVKIRIEGISPDGKIISETRTIPAY